VALARIDPLPLHGPQAVGIADARLRAEAAPIPLPTGDEQGEERHDAEQDPAPGLLRYRSQGHRLRDSRPVRRRLARIGVAIAWARRCIPARVPVRRAAANLRTGNR